jgi:hypothetical protein
VPFNGIDMVIGQDEIFLSLGELTERILAGESAG